MTPMLRGQGPVRNGPSVAGNWLLWCMSGFQTRPVWARGVRRSTSREHVRKAGSRHGTGVAAPSRVRVSPAFAEWKAGGARSILWRRLTRGPIRREPSRARRENSDELEKQVGARSTDGCSDVRADVCASTRWATAGCGPGAVSADGGSVVDFRTAVCETEVKRPSLEACSRGGPQLPLGVAFVETWTAGPSPTQVAAVFPAATPRSS